MRDIYGKYYGFSTWPHVSAMEWRWPWYKRLKIWVLHNHHSPVAHILYRHKGYRPSYYKDGKFAGWSKPL